MNYKYKLLFSSAFVLREMNVLLGHVEHARDVSKIKEIKWSGQN